MSTTESECVIPPKDIEIVIASYRENLWYVDFLKEKGYKVTVYNTNEKGTVCFKQCPETQRLYDFKEIKHTKLPNVSRETSQFLYHMINKKNEFSPYTLFMQADMGWSCGNNFRENFGADSPSLAKLLDWLRIAPATPFMPYQHTTLEHHWVHQGMLDDWDSLLAPFKMPPISSHQSIGAQFMCSKEFLERIPIEFLEILMGLCHSHGYTFAYKTEFAWPLLLDCYGQNWPIPEVSAIEPTTNGTEKKESSKLQDTTNEQTEKVNEHILLRKKDRQ